MRRIEFRAIEIATGRFVYGDYYYDAAKCCCFIIHSDGWRPTYNDPDTGEGNIRHEIDPNTLGQFTGLLDREGVEIFDGDVVTTDCGGNWVVAWNDHYGRVMLVQLGARFENKLETKAATEVIGNIHQNKELLEQKQ